MVTCEESNALCWRQACFHMKVVKRTADGTCDSSYPPRYHQYILHIHRFRSPTWGGANGLCPDIEERTKESWIGACVVNVRHWHL